MNDVFFLSNIKDAENFVRKIRNEWMCTIYAEDVNCEFVGKNNVLSDD